MSKESKVLKNETDIYYTVLVGNRVVTKAENIGTNSELITFYSSNARMFRTLEGAKQVAKGFNGKVYKHTTHIIKTEEIEEVEIDGQ